MKTELSEIVLGLREARSAAWPPTLRFFEWAGKQQPTPKETYVDDLKRALKLSKGDTAALIRGILDAKIGNRIVGRHGQRTRIAWLFSLASIAEAARGSSNTLDSMETSFMVGGNYLTHSFRLRPEYEIKMALPRDLTKTEASRLAAFIQTLPFED